MLEEQKNLLKRQKEMFENERKQWALDKGTIETEKKRLMKLQLDVSAKYEREFQEFISEMQDQRKQLNEDRLKVQREVALQNEQKKKLIQELEALKTERERFEEEKQSNLPQDVRDLKDKVKKVCFVFCILLFRYERAPQVLKATLSSSFRL